MFGPNFCGTKKLDSGQKERNSCQGFKQSVLLVKKGTEINGPLTIGKWKSTIGDVVRQEIGQQKWDEAYGAVRDEFALDEDQKLYSKNSHVISATLEQLWKQSSPSQELDKLCDQILSFASNGTSALT